MTDNEKPRSKAPRTGFWELKPANDLGLGPLERSRSLRREGGLVDFLLRGFWWAGLRSILRLWNGYRVIGQENLPPSLPYVLIGNHASHMDFAMMTLAVPVRARANLFALAAEDHFFGQAMLSLVSATVLNALPISRGGGGKGREGINLLRERLLTERCGVILFPEGTRTRDGTMGRFRAGIGNLVAGTPVPVVPCYIDGAFEAFPANRVFPKRRRVTLRIGAPVTFAEYEPTKEGCEAVAALLQERVVALAADARKESDGNSDS